MLWGVCLVSQAQAPIERILESVAANNMGVKAVQEQAVADRAALSAANSLENPTFDFEYLWGEQHIPGGNKYGFSIMQGFDFPSLYVQRNKISRAQETLGDRQVRYALQNTLLQARGLCIRLVYLNKQIALVTERVAIADTLAALYNRRLEEGDANRIEVNKVELERLSQTTRLKLLYSERTATIASLVACNGGSDLPVGGDMLTEYPVIAAPATEQEAVAVWQAEDASLQLLRQQQEMAEMQLSVARQGWIPKFELGYKQAYEVGDMFYGFAVGISLPLFKTGSEVKAERARALSQAWQAEDAAVQKASEASQLYREVTALQSALQDYELLKQQLLKQEDIKSPSQLFELGYFNIENLSVTNNFYLTPKSIIFVYEPYEIACFALGETKIELNFSDIEAYLKDPNLVNNL